MGDKVERPALKASIPYFVENSSVHFRLAGQLISLEDPDGRVLALLKLLDGERSLQEVHAAISPMFPDVTFTDIRDAIRDLDDSALLQDMADRGEDFDAAARERWSRNLGFFETYSTLATSKFEFQRRIRDAKVGVLGIGGIGSHVLIDLVAIGFHDIRIVDFDTIELSNLNRQILYGESFIGRAKIEVATERAKAFNSSARIDPVQLKITSAEDVYHAVHDRDVVIAAVDRPKMHILDWLNEGCVRAGTALISGGVETQRAVHFTVVPGISGCIQCMITSIRASDPTSRMVLDKLHQIDREESDFGEDTAAFDGLVLFGAAFAVAELVRLTTRVSPPLSVGRQLEMTFHDPRLRVAQAWERDPGCPICHSAAPKPALQWLTEIDTPLPF